MPDYEVDSPEFKAWVRSSGGGGGGTRGGVGGGGGGFPGLASSSALSPTLGGNTSVLGTAMRRRLSGSGGMLGAMQTPASAAPSMPSTRFGPVSGLSTTPTMSVYGTAAGGSPMRRVTPGPAQPMDPPNGGGNSGTGGWNGNGAVGSGGKGRGRGNRPPVDPTDPFANYSGNPKGVMDWIIHQAGQGGVFDVNGNPMIARMARENIMGDAGAREAAARTQALMRAGGDPSMAGFASLMSGLNSQSDASNAANDAALKSALTNQQWIRDILAAQMAPRAAQQKQDSGFLNLLGQLGGAAIGAVL